MSTPRARRAALASVFLAAVSVAPAHARATPSLLAASESLPESTRASLLGGRTHIPVLRVDTAGVVRWSSEDEPSLARLSSDRGMVSVGATLRGLLDQSVPRIGATAVRTSRGLAGRGVLVAVVDTGLDVRHRDLRTAEGATRVAWMLDLSQPARGVHPELEARFGFVRDDGLRYGAVFSAADLDAMLAREERTGVRDDALPVDEVGHGTFVTSIAAGNGLATGNGLPAGRYVGVAPEASVIAVRAAGQGTDRFTDAAVVAGVAFAVDRAQAMGAPLVVNLSVGSHFGAHDGSSALERALTSLVPEDAPGRALVVAAGNDGNEPVHARMDLARDIVGETAVTLPAAEADDVVALEVVYEGAARLSVRFPSGAESAWVSPGERRGFASDGVLASVANATDDPPWDPALPSLSPRRQSHSATVLFAGDGGRARREGRVTLRVEGDGVVHVYLAEPGRARPRASIAAVLFDEGTLMVPATARGVLAVGAATTRLSWTTLDRSVVEYNRSSSYGELVVDRVAGFSSRGPNRVNEARPDVIAPGAFVVAAMSGQATPDEPLSVFRVGDSAESALVAEDGVHGAGAGTSAAAPHVAGAIALLLQARPRATQREVRAALAAGARGLSSGGRWSAAEGWGEVSVERALAVLEGAGATGVVDAARSEVRVTAGTLAADEPASVLVWVADANGDAVTGARVVRVECDRGEVVGDAEPLGGGRWATRFRAARMSAGEVATITARIDGVAIERAARVQVVASVANGLAGHRARGGCAVAGGARGASGARGFGWVVVAAGLVAVRRRHPQG